MRPLRSIMSDLKDARGSSARPTRHARSVYIVPFELEHSADVMR